MDPITAGISAVSGLAGGVLGAIGSAQNNKWARGAADLTWQQGIAGQQAAIDNYFKWGAPAYGAAQQNFEGIGNQLAWNTPGLYQQAMGNYGNVGNIFQNAGGLYMTPQMQQYADQFGSLAGGMGQYSDLAGQAYAGGGWTPQYQQAFDTMTPYMQGQGSNSQLALGDVGSNLIGQRGQTAFTQGLQDRATDASQTQGMNPTLQLAQTIAGQQLSGGGYNSNINSLFGQGSNILGAGGYTPSSQYGEQASAGLLRANGATPYNQALQAQGINLAGTNALMSPDQAASFAEDTAARTMQGQREAVYRQAAARGGGPGSITAGGTSEQMKADFADQAAQLQAQQVQGALQNQQGLMQNQQQIGSGMVGTGGANQNSLFGTSGGIFGNMGQLANQRLGTGAGLAQGAEGLAQNNMNMAYSAIPGTQNAGTNVMSSLLNAGMGAGNLENARMGTGAGMAGSLLGNQLGYGQLYNSTMGNQNQYALGSGNLYNSMMGQQGGLNNLGFQSYLGSGQLGVGRANDMAGQYTSAQNAVSNLYGNMSNVYGTSLQGGINLSSPFISNANANIGLMQSAYGGITGGITNPYGGLASNFGGIKLPGIGGGGNSAAGFGNAPGDLSAEGVIPE